MSKLEFQSVAESQSRREARKTDITNKRSITPETRKYDQTEFGKKLNVKLTTKKVVKTKVEGLNDSIFLQLKGNVKNIKKNEEGNYIKTDTIEENTEIDVGQFLFKMPYSNGKQTVFRLGIDAETDKIKDFVKYFNNEEHTLQKDQNPALSNWSKISKKANDLQHYIKYAEKHITDIEKSIVNSAKEHLETHKTVVIDVFARDEKGNINLENGIPETHTVVLYKQNNKCLVIDPSNATFSTILSGVEDMVCCFDKNMQIYKPVGETGKESWRDCIDIAVKLAFGLEEEKCNINLSKIKECSYIKTSDIQDSFTIKNITNQQQLYNSLPKEIKDFVCRIKQSSDVVKSKVSTLFFKVLKQMHLNKSDELEQTKIDPMYTQKKYDTIYSNTLKDHTIKDLKKDNVLKIFKELIDSFELANNSNDIEKFYIEELGNIDSSLVQE